MKVGRFVWFGLTLVLGCSRYPEGSNATTAASSNATAGASTGQASPAPSASCSPTAYRHESPDFCVELPAAARGKTPTAIDNGVSFPGIVFQWTPKSNAELVAEWKAPRPAAQHAGTFEVWTTEPIPRGNYFVIYDATQHKMNDIYKIPSVSGEAVVEGETMVVRCRAYYNLERDDDPHAIAKSHAAELAACKSLQLFGRS